MGMGTYKFTFQDGSEAICHYGVLGMKWGRRKDGRPQGYSNGQQRVNGVLSPRAKKIAKGIAIGAGVAAAAYGAHKLGMDAAAIDFVRNHKRGLATDIGNYVHRQGKILDGSRKLGNKAMGRSFKLNREIASKAAANTGQVPKAIGNHAQRVQSNMKRLASYKTEAAKAQGSLFVDRTKASAGRSAVSRILNQGSAANAARARAAAQSSQQAASGYIDAVTALKRKKRFF